MKRFMRVLSVILALTLVAPLITGGAANRVKAAEVSAEEIIEQAEENFRKAASFEISALYKLAEQQGEKKGTMQASMEGTVFTKNPRLKVDIKLSASDGIPENDREQNVQLYMDKIGKQYFGYIKCNGKWQKEKLKKSDYLESIKEFKENVISLSDLEDIENWVVSEETINGKAAWLLTAEVKEEDIEELLDEMGSGYAAADLDLEDDTDDTDDADDADDPENGWDDMELKPIIVKMWIDKESMLPVKLSIDMKDYMQSMMDSVMSMFSEGMEGVPEAVQFSEAMITLEYKNINNAKDYSLPKAARKARTSKVSGPLLELPSDIDF